MTKIERLLDFLAHLDIEPELADSPWPTYTPDMGQLIPIDYMWLFPTGGEFEWSPEDLTNVLDQVMGELEDDAGEDTAGERQGEIIRHDDRVADWDICAWYQQIHFHGQKWGIYIRQDCLIRQARRIYLEAGGGGPWIALQALLASLAIYFLHEHFHHKVESLAIRMQVVQPAVRRYPDYWYNVYNQTLGTDDNLEEALANADSWRRLNEPRHKKILSDQVREAARRYLERRFLHDPPGYRRAQYLLKERFFRDELYVLSSQIDEGTPAPSRVAAGRQRDWDWAPQMSRSLFSWCSRIHLIVAPGTQPALARGPIVHVP